MIQIQGNKFIQVTKSKKKQEKRKKKSHNKLTSQIKNIV